MNLAPNRANDANEATFSKIQSHTPTPLTGIYGSDRSIAVSVFATPL